MQGECEQRLIRSELIGWCFTEEEERQRKIACALAEKFMKTFGKGREPYEIDYSHYENSKPQKKECRKKNIKQR